MQRPKPIHHSNSQNWEGPLSEPVRKKKNTLKSEINFTKIFIAHQFLRVKIFLFPLARKLSINYFILF